MKPLKFTPVLKTPLWGGRDIVALKQLSQPQYVGESWEVSGVPGDETPVAKGDDAGKTLRQLIEQYGADFVGTENLRRYGKEFPLLVKFISADRALSIQVHPDDEMAQRVAGKPYGKTEMWYVVQTHPGADLYCGFNRALTPQDYDNLMAEGRITEALAHYETRPGDCFFIPAGQIHSIGRGNFIIEIQQSSDLTYRVYDFDRIDADGRKRELHVEQAREALNFSTRSDHRTAYEPTENKRIELERHPQFTTSLYHLTRPLRADYGEIDSFVILVAFEGTAQVIDDRGNETTLRAGETVMLPALTKFADIRPCGNDRFSCIETYVVPV